MLNLYTTTISMKPLEKKAYDVELSTWHNNKQTGSLWHC